MNAVNAIVVIDGLLQLISQATTLGELFRKRMAEGSDVTPADLAELRAQTNAVWDAVEAEIARQLAEATA